MLQAAPVLTSLGKQTSRNHLNQLNKNWTVPYKAPELTGITWPSLLLPNTSMAFHRNVLLRENYSNTLRRFRKTPYIMPLRRWIRFHQTMSYLFEHRRLGAFQKRVTVALVESERREPLLSRSVSDNQHRPVLETKPSVLGPFRRMNRGLDVIWWECLHSGGCTYSPLKWLTEDYTKKLL